MNARKTLIKSTLKKAIIAALLVLVACQKSGSRVSWQKPYQDPSQGQEVDLRPASFQAKDELEKKGVKFENAKAQVLLKEKKVRLSITKISAAAKTGDAEKREDIALTGDLNEQLIGWMSDTQKNKFKIQRLKGYAECQAAGTSSPCGLLIIQLYFVINNQLESYQLIVRKDLEVLQLEEYLREHNGSADETPPNLRDQQTPPNLKEESPPVAEDAAELAPGNLGDDVAQDAAAVPEAPEAEEFPEAEHGIGESMVDESSGNYRVDNAIAEAPKNFFDDFFDDQNSATKALEAVTKPKVDASLTAWMNLKSGGMASGHYNSGSILNQGTLMPKQNPGLKRYSNDKNAVGTGFLIAHLQESAKRFFIEHPECRQLVVGNMSKTGGGRLSFTSRPGQHASHQNGLEADIAYLPLSNGAVVMNGEQMASNFNYACNFNFWDQLTHTNLPDGKSSVHVIFVNYIVKRGFCEWAKKTGRISPRDKETQRRIFGIDAHHDHWHMRLECPPGHKCWVPDDSVPEDGDGCALNERRFADYKTKIADRKNRKATAKAKKKGS